MPLKDHFHPPLSEVRHWESFHARWATGIADLLEGELLPPGYFAEVHVHVGNQIEVDIAAFEDEHLSSERASSDRAVVTATATATVLPQLWTPPAPAMTMPGLFPDRLEVLIFSSDAGPTLVSAVELVSPRNEDRPESRRLFAAKCANFLQQGVGLVVIDVVTNRRANLHNELVQLLGLDEGFLFENIPLYAVAYRPVVRGEDPQIDVWPHPLAVGDDLPILPLPLDKGQCVPLDLESSYSQACERMRFPVT